MRTFNQLLKLFQGLWNGSSGSKHKALSSNPSTTTKKKDYSICSNVKLKHGDFYLTSREEKCKIKNILG
jgi:hypothetical protein